MPLSHEDDEEQGVTTQEIVRSMGQASVGTGEMTMDIA